MSTIDSEHILTPLRRDLGETERHESVLDNEFMTTVPIHAPAARPKLSLTERMRRLTRGSPWRSMHGDESVSPPVSERPPIPSALAPSGETSSIPLPVLPMIVLSIIMLGEFLSANVSTPFLLFMVKGFGGFQDDAEVGYWTGILVSCFFITQFLTSLLWATAAEKHGTRTVLFTSLIGSSLTCFAFGTSTSLPQAMCIRLLQGVFAGAIGVGRGNVATITDPSNEGRAYAILGFCWGFGGVAGAIIGGSFESPAEKWPEVFSRVSLFVKYPYLLPTTIAASITFTGAVLALCLARDGGPREGAIRLPPEKNATNTTIPEEPNTPVEESPSGVLKQLKHRVSRKLSSYFAKRVRDTHGSEAPNRTPPVPLSTSIRQGSNNRIRTFSRTSRADGSAYGYGGQYRRKFTNNVSRSLAGRRGSLASNITRRRSSNMHGYDAETPGSYRESEGGELNFAQRLLMANELAVTNIADLWVAAAMNADNEDVFFSGSEEDDDDFFRNIEDEEVLGSAESPIETPTRTGRPFVGMSTSRFAGVPSSPPPTERRGLSTSTNHRPSSSGLRPQFGSPRRPSTRPSGGGAAAGTPRRTPSSVPAIFTHTGVRTPFIHESPVSPGKLLVRQNDVQGVVDADEGLDTVPERHQILPTAECISEKQPSMFSQLPIMIIVQYGLLALHSTTHDQVYLSYLVTKYQSGGLNLNAGHFAQLIALMSLASIAYQFYLYPNMGPPRGRFSHLAMFRIGSLLFIPAYLTVIVYRPLANANDDGNLILMVDLLVVTNVFPALAFSTALRYAGITFAYTAVAILLNYTSPPHILGYANGIAQSIVSFARFVGPILGGYLWSVSVESNSSGYPLGFLVCAGVTTIAIAHSFFIR